MKLAKLRSTATQSRVIASVLLVGAAWLSSGCMVDTGPDEGSEEDDVVVVQQALIDSAPGQGNDNDDDQEQTASGGRRHGQLGTAADDCIEPDEIEPDPEPWHGSNDDSRGDGAESD
jgi:hypothetical protein